MKRLLRGLCALLLMTLLLPTALAAKATPTPPPVAISTEAPVQPPEQIQQVLDIAYNEWAELDGKTLKNVNKYTEWRGKGIGFGLDGGKYFGIDNLNGIGTLEHSVNGSCGDESLRTSLRVAQANG